MSEYKLVPVELTTEMMEAFKSAYKEGSIWTDRITIAVEAMLSASPTSDTITIDRTEFEVMKADAERWRYFRETASEEMCYALCGNSNAENEELDQAIDQARKI